MRWNTARKRSLDFALVGYGKIGKTGEGVVLVRQQVTQGTAMLLSSQFQGFCRDLHSECVDAFVAGANPGGAGNAVTFQTTLRAEFLMGRKLETGNPNPGNLGSDFNRFGLKLFAEMITADEANQGRKDLLEELNVWRNAIGHQDFNKPELNGRTTITIQEVKDWREACGGLATSMDSVMHAHLLSMLGVAPR
ncbi:MAG: hypothetical protein ACRC33_06350 [Gemmataceae bacterium]